MTFGPPMFSSHLITETFFGKEAQEYMKHSDAAMGTGVIKDYFEQLQAIGEMRNKNQSISIQQAILAALNIKWLTARGLIPNNEFNGIQYVESKSY